MLPAINREVNLSVSEFTWPILRQEYSLSLMVAQLSNYFLRGSPPYFFPLMIHIYMGRVYLRSVHGCVRI